MTQNQLLIQSYNCVAGRTASRDTRGVELSSCNCVAGRTASRDTRGVELSSCNLVKNLMIDVPNFAKNASFISLLKLSQTNKEMRERMLPILKAKRIQELKSLQTWLRSPHLNRNYTLDELINVNRLALFYNKPIMKIPPEIGQLTNLRELCLSYNQITFIPPEIGQLINLKELYLGGNQITVIPTDFFGEVSKAKPTPPWGLGQDLFFKVAPEGSNSAGKEIGQLTQQHSSFPEPHVGAGEKPAGAGSRHSSGVVAGRSPESEALVKQRCNLEIIDLSNNQIKEIPPEIRKLSNLKILRLTGNQIEVIPPEIGQLTQQHNCNLEYLYLDDNYISVIPPEIGQLTHLDTLDLSQNQITEIPPEIGLLINLKIFHLYRNRITKIPPEIGQLTNLRELSLNSNQITKIPPEIGQLTNLKRLYLWSNQITKIPP